MLEEIVQTKARNYLSEAAARIFFPRIKIGQAVFCERSLLWTLFGARNPPQHHHKPLTKQGLTQHGKILQSENSQANHSAPISAQASGACKPNAIADKLLNTIAKTASEVGDIRFGFQVLLTAALLAEKNQRETISAEDVASALEEENRIRKLKEIEALKDKLVKRLKKYKRD